MLVAALGGHGKGSIDAVAWNPREVMFASCSDEHTIRIWETLPSEMTTKPDNCNNPPFLCSKTQALHRTRGQRFQANIQNYAVIDR